MHPDDLLVVLTHVCNVHSVDVDGRHIVDDDRDLKAMVGRLYNVLREGGFAAVLRDASICEKG